MLKSLHDRSGENCNSFSLALHSRAPTICANGHDNEQLSSRLARQHLARFRRRLVCFSLPLSAHAYIIFYTGGQNASRDTCDSAFCYSTRVNQWMRMPSMNERRKGCAAATCRGSLFVAGGCTAGRVGVGGEQQTKATRRRRLGSVRRFDAGSCRWIDDVADMPSAGDQFALVSNEHCLFAIGNGVERCVNVGVFFD